MTAAKQIFQKGCDHMRCSHRTAAGYLRTRLLCGSKILCTQNLKTCVFVLLFEILRIRTYTYNKIKHTEEFCVFDILQCGYADGYSK